MVALLSGWTLWSNRRIHTQRTRFSIRSALRSLRESAWEIPLAVGAILDIFSALVIMVPIILPVALSYGIDPVHLGIIFLANMQIGYMTPPVGMNLFIASYRFEKNISEIYSAALPFMIVLLVALLVITYVPGLMLLFRS